VDQGHAERVTETPETAAVPETEPVAVADAPVGDLMETLKAQLAESESHLKRMMADFDNARKRQAAERESLIKFAAEQVVLNLLPVVDNFDRAMGAAQTATDVATVIQGIELIYRQLQDVLTKAGAAPIEATGQTFDPERHEAVQRVPADDQPDNTVVEEFQRGYLLNGKVIRPALVKVAVAG